MEKRTERRSNIAMTVLYDLLNYEPVLAAYPGHERDLPYLCKWGLIILDEGPPSSASKTGTPRPAGIIKGLKCRFALVLSGTALGENRTGDENCFGRGIHPMTGVPARFPLLATGTVSSI